jgi:hypothetical protein
MGTIRLFIGNFRAGWKSGTSSSSGYPGLIVACVVTHVACVAEYLAGGQEHALDMSEFTAAVHSGSDHGGVA